MSRYPMPAVERAMKVQEVILKAASGQITWADAAEILGVTCRTMRRWKLRYVHRGYDGLFDRRRQQPSPRRVPLAVVEHVLRLYRGPYAGFNVRHFHEKLAAAHGITLSYQWVKLALQGAGLVPQRAKRGPHRQRRERRPLRGMMLYADGSTHAWLPTVAGTQDLILIMDDANSEVYSACLVEEEGSLTTMAGVKEVVATRGIFCSLYTDRGSHFFHTPKVGGEVARGELTQIGCALQALGIQHIASYCPQGRGRIERTFGTWQGRLPQELRAAGITTMEQANVYIRQQFIPWHNAELKVAAAQPGDAFVPCGALDLDAIFCLQHERSVAADNTVSFGTRRLQIGPSAWRVSFAKCRVKVCEHLDGHLSIRYGPHVLGRYAADGLALEEKSKRAKAA